MMRHLMAAAVAVAFAATTFAPAGFAAPQPEKDKVQVLKKKKPVKVDKPDVALKKPQAPKAKQGAQKPQQLVARRDCKGFMQCLFGSRKVRVTTNAQPVQYASLAGAGLSGRKSRQTVDWSETKYPVGSLIVRTPERALYFVSAKGEAIRYSVGVGKEGMQWSGASRIDRKAEWPSWTPPAEMIKREAAKGHISPPFMEGGPGNPLGARALYIGGRIYRVHGTNNEASIGGAVSSGCIRMMNADVIDLYDRVKIGAKIYVYQ